ncbi:hypothetical protein QFW77_18265 [Luteimonas sp. RD2P54]|uniref:Secreted protein n=1 Tax=Luteimonas endophytica TaxID=3042023 RepID=A0ABT6JDV5_9GAMM|nr:hypothetical protein [Luteimonas endophytica]MDH5824914.1 hypothetical protein [Luteimonas endophytica]
MNTYRSLPLLAAIALVVGAGHAGNSVSDPAAKIVRGFNGAAPCNAKAIGAGSSPAADPDEDMSNLSVSCSDDRNVTFSQLRQPLPNAHACVTTLGDLRAQRRAVAVVKDPTDDNPYHCVLSTITPREFVSGSRYQP